jgi:hypothetical protein
MAPLDVTWRRAIGTGQTGQFFESRHVKTGCAM